MPEQLSPETKQLLDRPNFAHLATLMSDGSPQSVPVWVGVEGEHILICTGEASLKARNTLRNNHVALSVVDFHNPYEEAQLRGRVVERRPDRDFKDIDGISHKYTASRSRFAILKGESLSSSKLTKPAMPSCPFNTPRQPSFPTRDTILGNARPARRFALLTL